MSDIKEIKPLKYWVQKVLPLVYDDSLSYYEVLNKVVLKLNALIENNNNLPDYIKNVILELITPESIRALIEEIFDDLRHTIAEADDGESLTATEDRKKADLLWWHDELYYVVRDMDIGDAYVNYGENPNIRLVTVEELIKNTYYSQDETLEIWCNVISDETIMSRGDYHVYNRPAQTIEILEVE